MKTIFMMAAALILAAGCDGGDTLPADKVNEPAKKEIQGSARGDSGSDDNDDDDSRSILDGVWEGQLTVTNSAGKHTRDVVLTFDDDKFECQYGMHPDIGRYSISGDKITFSAEGIYPAIVLLMDILDGEYHYPLQGDRLTLVADDGDCRREYTLTKHINK